MDEVWQNARGFTLPAPAGAAYVFQDADLFSHLSVRGNLEFGRRRAGDRAAIAFDAVVALLGLEPLPRRSPARLSGGERQRVAIGRALLSQPRLLLLDEPLAGLDAAAKAEILPYLEALHAEVAVPMIYVSHDVGEIARLADHLVVMKSGRVVAFGPCDRWLHRPCNTGCRSAAGRTGRGCHRGAGAGGPDGGTGPDRSAARASFDTAANAPY